MSRFIRRRRSSEFSTRLFNGSIGHCAFPMGSMCLDASGSVVWVVWKHVGSGCLCEVLHMLDRRICALRKSLFSHAHLLRKACVGTQTCLFKLFKKRQPNGFRVGLFKDKVHVDITLYGFYSGSDDSAFHAVLTYSRNENSGCNVTAGTPSARR